MDKGTYVLSGSLPVHDELEAEQIERIRQHLGGIATVYLAHDQTAHAVSLHISGTMLRDDARIIEKRIEKFAEENGTAGAILLSEWNGLSGWLIVGLTGMCSVSSSSMPCRNSSQSSWNAISISSCGLNQLAAMRPLRASR